MATAAKLVERVSRNVTRVTWTLAAAGDDGEAFKIPAHEDITFQAVSAGSTDAASTLALVGNNLSAAAVHPDAARGLSFSSPFAFETKPSTFGTGAVDDGDGGTAISTTLGTVPTVTFGSDRAPLWVKPTLTGGTATTVKVILTVRAHDWDS